MATATFSDSSSSVNPSSPYEALQQRLSLVEEDNHRLRHQITVVRHIAPAEQEIHEEAGPDCSACRSFFKTAA